jgi:hypothetical protein
MMANMDLKRLSEFESRLGRKLPPDFKATLTEREPIREGNVALIKANRVWDIRTTFALDDGDRNGQLDVLYSLVGDVVPIGALPFAADWGDNLYCLMLSGPQSGQVVWWDHERDVGDNSVESVAESLRQFFEGLVPDPRE